MIGRARLAALERRPEVLAPDTPADRWLREEARATRRRGWGGAKLLLVASELVGDAERVERVLRRRPSLEELDHEAALRREPVGQGFQREKEAAL